VRIIYDGENDPNSIAVLVVVVVLVIAATAGSIYVRARTALPPLRACDALARSYRGARGSAWRRSSQARWRCLTWAATRATSPWRSSTAPPQVPAATPPRPACRAVRKAHRAELPELRVRGVGVDIDPALIDRANAKLAQRALAAPAPAPAAGALAAAPSSVFLAGDVCDETVVARLLEEAKNGACVRACVRACVSVMVLRRRARRLLCGVLLERDHVGARAPRRRWPAGERPAGASDAGAPAHVVTAPAPALPPRPVPPEQSPHH
jgi:hypothetical protein